MGEIGIDRLMKGKNSIYKLAILAARRAQEISQGAKSLVECALGMKPTTVALKEIVEGKIDYKIRKKE
ncbi:MAG: DNA-directed RNA polymerase subunit omega [Candidatus Omnitrophota bacterium]